MGSKLAQNLLKYPGSCLKFKHLLKIANKPPITSWVFITELVNVLKIDKKNLLKPPGSSLTLKNVLKLSKKKLLKDSGSSLQN
jgi:hypothetical protein